MKKKEKVIEQELYIVPSKNDEMKAFVNKFKVDMMERVVNSIKFAMDNKMDMVEIFTFKDSPFVVTMSDKEFKCNLEHIAKFYKEHEFYELFPRVEKLCEIVEKNENETSKTNG